MRALPSCWMLLALGFVVACAGDPEPTVDGSVTQRTSELRVGTGPVLLVLTVDDGPSPAAGALRTAFVAGELRPMLRRVARLPDAPKRASEWWPVDVTVIVVHPSQPTSLALALHRLHVLDVDDAAFEAWAAAIASDVRDHVAGAGARYAPIASAVDAERAVTHWRLPADDAEAKAIADLPAFGLEAFAYLTTRDDDSADPPVAFAPPKSTWWEVEVLHDCDTPELPRFKTIDGWVGSEASLGALECPSARWHNEFFADWGEPSLQGRCPFWDGRRVARDADGGAQCRLTFSAPNVDCNPARGWSDPRSRAGDRVPTWDEYGNRICEIRLLTGAAADGCIRGTQALDAGWCIAPGTAATGTAGCDPFAFTRNALPGDLRATLHLACDMQR